MQFLADMGVNMQVVEWLRRQGHDVKHLCEEGLQRLDDADIFRKAIAEKRVLLTFDLDFGEVAAFSGGAPVGVILFRLHNTRTDHVINRLAGVLAIADDTLTRGAVVLVEESRCRIRSLPFKKTETNSGDS